MNALEGYALRIKNCLRALALPEQELRSFRHDLMSVERVIADELDDCLAVLPAIEASAITPAFSGAEWSDLRALTPALQAVLNVIYSTHPQGDFDRSWSQLRANARSIMARHGWEGKVDWKQLRG